VIRVICPEPFHRASLLCVSLSGFWLLNVGQSPATRSPVDASGFIFESAPFPSSHASTIVETKTGLLAAWFGGTREGHADVSIWVARRDQGRWTPPVEVATCDGHPCWNPVLYQPDEGPLMLFYKAGPNPREWWGMVMTSSDGGRSWSQARRLPPGFLGPVRSKPVMVGDRLLCGSSTEHDGWRVHMEWTDRSAERWEKVGPLETKPRAFEAIQPTILTHPGNRIQILCRTRQGVIAQAWSSDGGKTWGPLTASELPNPSAGIDAVRLKDGRFLLVYNHTTSGRSPLNVAISNDGVRWIPSVALEQQPGEYSYPAVIQTQDGKVHVTYTWRRERIKHVVLDPDAL
jgi:predicted neuraminidase